MRTSTLLKWVAAFSVLISTSLVAEDNTTLTSDLNEGKTRSVICIGCHGMNGEGKEAANGQPAFPRISGQLKSYLIKSVNDYKSGSRNDPIMGAIAKGLSDNDIANLAAYYANQKCVVK